MARPRNPKPDRNFWRSGLQNTGDWVAYYDRLTELSISMFDWKGLPDTIDERYMELVLFSQGHAVFFRDEVLGYLCLQCAIGSRVNIYNIPTRRNVITANGYHRRLNEKDSVLIYNNNLHTNSVLTVEIFAKKLYELDRAIEVNSKAQKTPILITCDEKQRLAMLNMYQQYDGNEPAIFGDKALNTGDIKAFSTGAPYVADKLYTLKTQIWNEALTYLGITNVNITKKERLITDEVQRNQGGTIASRESRLMARQKACKEINKQFGLNIWVEFKADTKVQDDFILDNKSEKESENNG